MEAVIFVGLQGAGKTTFYRQRFARTHLRISLDDLKTRAREWTVLSSALAQQQDFVIDNTNPTRLARQRYIQPAKAANYEVAGYFFEPDIQACLRRNAARPQSERVPPAGLFGTRKRLQAPTLDEGFARLYQVSVGPEDTFLVRDWINGGVLSVPSAA